MREIKFRAWMPNQEYMADWENVQGILNTLGWENFSEGEKVLMQYTGLKDKNGKEIYELHEIDKKYRVIYDRCSYVLQDISSGDIFGLLDNSIRGAHEREITGEYSPMA